MGKQIGILGSGKVGQALGKGLAGSGYNVTIGSRSGHAIEGWDGPVGTLADVAQKADLIILAIKGSAAIETVKTLQNELGNKTVIDTTNPIADDPPEDGVLRFFTDQNLSLMEQLQSNVPAAHFVKAFNSVGSVLMVHPKFASGQPTMFICGDDETAKNEAKELIRKLGWEVEDMGSAKSARAIEPLCKLWCIPTMLRGQSTHAFKLLKS